MYSPPLPSKIIHTHDWNIDESAIALMSIEQCCRYIMTRTIYLFMHYLFTSSLQNLVAHDGVQTDGFLHPRRIVRPIFALTRCSSLLSVGMQMFSFIFGICICIYLCILAPIGFPYHLMSVSFNRKTTDDISITGTATLSTT